MALNDLNQMFSIVDPNTGKPTDYLMRLLRDRGQGSQSIEELVKVLEQDVQTSLALVAALQGRNINTGFGLSGGGDLTANRTISLGNPALVDPNNDRILFWDDSAGQLQWLTPGTNLTITDTTLNATGGGGGGLSPIVCRTVGFYAHRSQQGTFQYAELRYKDSSGNTLPTPTTLVGNVAGAANAFDNNTSTAYTGFFLGATWDFDVEIAEVEITPTPSAFRDRTPLIFTLTFQDSNGHYLPSVYISDWTLYTNNNSRSYTVRHT